MAPLMPYKSVPGRPLVSAPEGGCEWDAEKQQFSRGDNAHYKVRATLLVHMRAMNEIRLCADCAALPKFSIYKKRFKI
jgi:hypothetical protein